MSAPRTHVVDVSQATLEANALEASHERPVLLAFWATWCEHCRVLGPILGQLAADSGGGLLLARVDVEAEPVVAQRFRARAVPMVVALRGGQVIDEVAGALTRSQAERFVAGVLGRSSPAAAGPTPIVLDPPATDARPGTSEARYAAACTAVRGGELAQGLSDLVDLVAIAPSGLRERAESAALAVLGASWREDEQVEAARVRLAQLQFAQRQPTAPTLVGEVAFTPYVDVVRADAEARLAELFGVQPGVDVGAAVRGSGADLQIVAWLGDRSEPALELDLRAATEGARAWFVGEAITLSYRRLRDGGDPYEVPETRATLEALRARVSAWDAAEGLEGGPLRALVEALSQRDGLQEIEDYMYRQARPRELVIRLGFRCNQNCWFCWQGRQWPEPPSALYRTWLDEAAAAGCGTVHFSGGEPTIHPDLPDLMRRAHRVHGMEVWIQSNAVQLAKPRYLERLIDAGLRGVFVSYHSADAEVSDRMTRAPRTWGRTVLGVEACLAAGVTVELNCVVERANYAGLAAHAADIVERFVSPFPRNPVGRVSYSHPHEYYDREVHADAFVSLADVRPHMGAAAATLLAAGVAVEGVGTCGFPLCLVADRPELLRSLVPAEEHEMDAGARRYVPACDRCAARARCLGLRREYVERMGKDTAGVQPFAVSPFG